MPTHHDAVLLDFGEGRRLERLGGVLVDRPCPAAGGRRHAAAAWREAEAVFGDDAGGGSWRLHRALPSPWLVRVPLDTSAAAREIRLHIHPAPSGQLGIFPEQIPLWQRLHAWCGRCDAERPAPRVLSLFAHTGGATLAMAAAGAEVFHVDASRQAIRTARDNAKASGLAEAPIHWIEEDAVRYCRRLVRRVERFDAIVLDPPSYGHGPRGEAFAIDRDLPAALAMLGTLMADRGLLLLSCHSAGWDERRMEETIAAALPAATHDSRIETGELFCEDTAGRRLDLGRFAIGFLGDG